MLEAALDYAREHAVDIALGMLLGFGLLVYIGSRPLGESEHRDRRRTPEPPRGDRPERRRGGRDVPTKSR